jgi:hypothetical protein
MLVIVSGMIAATPGQGGASWAVLQYLLGLRRIGCDVFFAEPVDAVTPAIERYLRMVMDRYGLAGGWALVSPGDEASRARLLEAAETADVLINVSGMLTDADVLAAVPVRAYLDLDPLFNQVWHTQGADMRLDAHTHFVSIADAIGRDGCPIPDCGREWLPTLPPVVLDEWPFASELHREALTTVGHWRSYGSVHHEGVQYGQKVHSFRQIAELPRRTPARFELALAIHPEEVDDLRALDEHGWELLDPSEVADTPDAYRSFVQGSWGEFGLAKHGYALSGSGWFSDRSACYLASGRPVIAEATGFDRRLPVGAGLFAFEDAGDVIAAVEQLQGDYERHRAAARDIAEEYLASDRVLGRLLERLCS